MQHLGEPIHIHQVEGTDWILTPEYIVYDWREPRLQEENPGRLATVRQQSDKMQPRDDRRSQVFFLIVRPPPPTVLEEKHVQMCFFKAYRYKTKSTRDTETM